MATTRIDIESMKDGSFILIHHIIKRLQSAVVYPITDRMQKLDFGNWTIRADNRDLELISLSNASNDCHRRKKFHLQMREGSLFLFNSASDWYWYFRDKETQSFLDTYHINKMVSVRDTDQVELTQIHEIDFSGDYYSPIIRGKFQTIKVWTLPGSEFQGIKARVTVDQVTTATKIISTVTYKVNTAMLVQNRRDHMTLYINNYHDISEVKSYLDKHEPNFIEPRPFSQEGN